MYSLYRRHQYERQVKLGLREPKHRKMHGPPTYQQHLLRRQWRLRDSDEDTLLADDKTMYGETLGSKSTLTGGQFKDSRHRTVSMASTIYGAERSEEDSNATLDDFLVDEQIALETRERLAPVQMRPYSHLTNETVESRPPPAPIISLRRSSVNQTAEARPDTLRRRSAEEPTTPADTDKNIFEEELSEEEAVEQRQGRRETLFNFLNGSGLWNQKKSDR